MKLLQHFTESLMKQISICGDSPASDDFIGRLSCKNTTADKRVQNLNTNHLVPSQDPTKPANFGLQTKKPLSVKTVSAHAGQNTGASTRGFITPANNVSARRSKRSNTRILSRINPALYPQLANQLPAALEGLHGIFPTHDIMRNLIAQNGELYRRVVRALEDVAGPKVDPAGYLHECLGRELTKPKYGLRRIPNDTKRPNLNNHLSLCSDWEKVSEASK